MQYTPIYVETSTIRIYTEVEIRFFVVSIWYVEHKPCIISIYKFTSTNTTAYKREVTHIRINDKWNHFWQFCPTGQSNEENCSPLFSTRVCLLNPSKWRGRIVAHSTRVCLLNPPNEENCSSFDKSLPLESAKWREL